MGQSAAKPLNELLDDAVWSATVYNELGIRHVLSSTSGNTGQSFPASRVGEKASRDAKAREMRRKVSGISRMSRAISRKSRRPITYPKPKTRLRGAPSQVRRALAGTTQPGSPSLKLLSSPKPPSLAVSVGLPCIDVILSTPQVDPVPVFATDGNLLHAEQPLYNVNTAVALNIQSRSPSLPTVIAQPVPIYLSQPRPNFIRSSTCPDKAGDSCTPDLISSLPTPTHHPLPLPGTPSREIEASRQAYSFCAGATAEAPKAIKPLPRAAGQLEATVASSSSSTSYDSNKSRNIKILRVMNPDAKQMKREVPSEDSPTKSVNTPTSSFLYSPRSLISPVTADTPATSAPNSQPTSPIKTSNNGVNQDLVRTSNTVDEVRDEAEDYLAGLDKLALRLEAYLNTVRESVPDLATETMKVTKYAIHRKHRPTPLQIVPTISAGARPPLRKCSASSQMLSPHRFLSYSAGPASTKIAPPSPRPPTVNKLSQSSTTPFIPLHERKTTLGKDWYGELIDMYRPTPLHDDSMSLSLHPHRPMTQTQLSVDMAARLKFQLPSPFEATQIVEDVLEHAEHFACKDKAALRDDDASIRLIDLESYAGEEDELERCAVDAVECMTPRSAALARTMMQPSTRDIDTCPTRAAPQDETGDIDLTQDQYRQAEISLMRSHPPTLSPRRVSDNALLPPGLKLVEGNRTCSCGKHANEHITHLEGEDAARREARRERRKQRHQDALKMSHNREGIVHPLLAEHRPSDRHGRQLYPADLSDEERARYKAFDDLAKTAVADGNPFVANPNGAIRLGEYKRGYDDDEIDRWRQLVAGLAFPDQQRVEEVGNSAHGGNTT